MPELTHLDIRLEEMIDKHGLKAVLGTISIICGEKADHIMASYDDEYLSKMWTKNAAKIAQTASRVED